MPATEEQLKELAEESGALWDSGAGCWVMPFYNSASDVDYLPIGEWKRKRQQAAEELLVTRTKLPKLNPHPGPQTAFMEAEEGIDTKDPRIDHEEHVAAAVEFERSRTEPPGDYGKTLMEEQLEDNWAHRGTRTQCRTCMFYVPKAGALRLDRGEEVIGRCRERSPSIKGWPAVYPTDWCGAHKMDEEKL